MLAMKVDSIARETTEHAYEIIVVDDGSTDGSTDQFRGRTHDRVRLIRGGQLGVARARNLGARHARGEYLVFMDAHCRVSPGWLDGFAEVFRQPAVGMAGPSFTKLESPTPRGCGMYWADYTLDPCWFEPPDAIDSYDAPLTTGACQVFRRDTYEALGGYEPGFTRWGFEDVEMCLRAWLFGYRVAVQPAVTVAHYFREARDNYEVDDEEITYNFFRMVYLHFSTTRIRLVRDAVATNPHVAAAQERLADSDVFERRAAMLARRRFDDDWFFAEINGQPAQVV
jgi:GT2 family glycosyltransferase